MLWLSLFILPLMLFGAPVKEACQEVHHVFLIHGIGGGAGTFGSLAPILEHEDSCLRVETFEYDTGNSRLSTFDFAGSLHGFIKRKQLEQVIRPHDKLSLIMHSQGGIVGSLWLHQLKSTADPLIKQIDSFITLSTPFWGAEMASLGKTTFYTGNEKNPVSPFGKTELNEMSYGSGTINFLSSVLAEIFAQTSIRPLALGGMKRLNNGLLGEDDAVVPLYSSRPDHYQGHGQISFSNTKGKISADAFKKLELMPYELVAATHIKLDMPGIADLPSSCLKKECHHPALPFILKHFRKQAQVDPREAELKQFRVTIYIKNKSTAQVDMGRAELRMAETQDVTVPMTQLLRGYKGKALVREGTSFSFYGSAKGQKRIMVSLNLGNHLKRTIEIPVEGGYSSIMELDLVD